MAKSGPQKFAGASTSYWYQNRYPGNAMETNVIVWHSTEGTSLPSYSGGAVAPNLTAKPDFKNRRLVWYQHFDFDVSARALVNRSGGVQTNTLNVCQIEVVGTCDPGTHAKWTKAGYAHLYMPDLPDWAIRDLGQFAEWAHDKHGVPLSSDVTFKAYPSSYGATNVRMSYSKWTNYRGHCGHQHVPENQHGDPGAFPMAAILAAAKGDGPEPEAPPASGGGTYTVKAGDTLSSIGRALGVPWPDIAKANGIRTPYRILPGQTLTIPGSAPATPSYEPYPGASFFMNGSRPALGKRSAIFTEMGKRLVAVGCSHYRVGPGPVLGQADVDSYEAWQRKCGYSGAAATWPPGRTTWDKLKVPRS